jgi:2-hydroxy-6-oxonona-2,4-dienedioate hydrolase
VGHSELQDRDDTVGALTIHARTSTGLAQHARPDIVLVHGLLVSSRYMVPTAQCLAEQYRVWVPDLPGWGLSSKPAGALSVRELADTLIAWFDVVGIDRAVLVSNSFGCQVTVDLAARYPERVSLMVLLGPTVDPEAHSLWHIAGRWLLDVPHEPPSMGLLVLRDFGEMGISRFIANIRRMLEDRIETKLPAVKAPTLVLRGEYDTLVPTSWAVSAAQLMPHGRTIEIPGAAHTLNYHAPSEVTMIVETFIEEMGAEMGADVGVQRSPETPTDPAS